jgi:CDP-diacylglycerol--serine O-phosphatidyltransferase
MAFEARYEWALAFIIFSAVFDFFDGMMARALDAHSIIGKDLDSLADDVSFGVAPSLIVFSLFKEMDYSGAMESLAGVFPYLAFLLSVFSALRLAKFNNDTRQTSSFVGLPVPANALWSAFSHGCLYRRFQCSHSNSRICHGKTIKQASFSCLSAFRSSSSWESAAFLQSSSGIYCFRLLQGKVNKQIFGTVVVLKFAENEHIKRH